MSFVLAVAIAIRDGPLIESANFDYDYDCAPERRLERPLGLVIYRR